MAKNIEVVFAYASDSVELQKVVQQEIDKINNFISKNNYRINFKHWKNNIDLGVGIPEDKVLEGLNIPNSDLFIEIFRYSYGKPTGLSTGDGRRYDSGLVQEFDIAYESYKKNGHPQIALFKSEEDVPRHYCDTVVDDKKKMQSFFNECESNGNHPTLYQNFHDIDELRSEVNNVALSFAIKYICKNESRAPEDRKYYSDIFFADRNDERNSLKAECMQNSDNIYLSAKSCYSFLNQQGRFYSDFNGWLKNRMNSIESHKICVIMQNPLSINAIMTAIGYKKYNQFIKGKKNAEEIATAYVKSNWFNQRYLGSIDGYLLLKKKYNKLIELRLSDSDMSTSILITDRMVFFEPYLNSIEVGKKSLSVFEIISNKEADLYKDSKKDFDELWGSSYRCSKEYSKMIKKQDIKQEVINRLNCLP